MSRRYEQRERARRLQETRQRIVDATVALHEEVGPARTTIAEVARRAGVSRVTVYNHFPDEASLLGACSEHFAAAHPPPDIETWAAIENPRFRLRIALAQTYAYYRSPALAHILQEGGAAEYERAATEVAAGPYSRELVGLALAFGTWQRLTATDGLTDEHAADLMLKAITKPL